ncbi:MAG: M56 family metallopeptidase [Clostridium sp.]|uniref:M56 family metallopeptidase n=1 Tax=Clostridium sp. TaxID=1506 RepID=UPI003D6CD303
MGIINLLFRAILISSAMGSFLAIIIIIIKKLFKNKLSASWHYYIWMLLILRLAIPYSYQSPLSIFNIFTNTVSNFEVSLNIPSINNSKVEQSNVVRDTNDTITNKPITVSVENIIDINSEDLDLFSIASIIWFIVMVSTLLIIFIFNIIFNKRLRNQEVCKDKETLYILNSCQVMTGIKGNIPIKYLSNISGVSLYGMFKSRILISSKIIHNFTGEQKKYIFLHELIHLKYKDILINSIMLILVALNWFNPIIWYCFYRIQQDCELACDEKVLYYLQPNCYNNYGSTIINMAGLFSKSHNLLNGVGLLSNKSNLKRRISMISSFKGKSFKWSIIGAFLIALIAFVCLVNPKAVESTYLQTQINTDAKSAAGSDYQSVVQNFLNQKNLKGSVNSGAIEDIQLPSDFKAVKDGIKVGELLKQRNELSKQDNLDFSTYMGQKIKIYTCEIENGDPLLKYDIVILIAENKVVGHWTDTGMKDPRQKRSDFNVLVNPLQTLGYEEIIKANNIITNPGRVIKIDEIYSKSENKYVKLLSNERIIDDKNKIKEYTLFKIEEPTIDLGDLKQVKQSLSIVNFSFEAPTTNKVPPTEHLLTTYYKGDKFKSLFIIQTEDKGGAGELLGKWKKVKIKGKEAYISDFESSRTNDTVQIMFWNNGKYYNVSGTDLSKDYLLKIAESIK